MKEPEEKNPRGRPKLQIDEDLMKRYAHAQCTFKEIASKCGCSPDYLTKNYSELINEWKEEGKSVIRMAQFHIMTKKHSSQMAIFLGQEYLGQGKQATGTFDVSYLENLTKSLGPNPAESQTASQEDPSLPEQ